MSASVIERIETSILRIPTIRPHTLSVATMRDQRLVIIQLTDSDGIVGLGEATTIGGLAYTDESPDSIKLHLDMYFTEYLLGQPANPTEIMSALNKSLVGNYFAKSAVETALYDLLGKQTGKSVSNLLGSRRKNALPVAWTLASGDTDQDIEEGHRMLAEKKHKLFKLKIGKKSLEEDIKHATTIADTFSGSASVRVDVNQAWSLDEAMRAIPALAEAGVELIEQPIPANDPLGARKLCGLSDAKVMADEALRGGLPAAQAVLREGAANVLSLKIAQAGGLTNCRKVAELATSSGIELYGGTMLEGGVGTVASAHLFATLPDFAWGTELFGPLLLQQDILSKPLEYRDFSIAIPDAPGLGISLHPDAIAEFSETPN